MRILAMTRVYPNRVEPHGAPFNRQQIEALSELADVDVLAVIPWFPGASLFSRWSRAGRLASLPSEDLVGRLRVRHPRFLYLPKSVATAPALFAASVMPAVAAYKGRVDAIYTPWAFPDGCAAVALARLLGVPCIVTVMGSDLNVIGARRAPGWWIRRALPRADRVLTRSRPLADKVVALGVPASSVRVLLNGVDRERFHPRDRGEARRRLGLPDDQRIVLQVGRLEDAKGVFDLLEAFERCADLLPSARLVFIGDGPDRARLASRADALGDRVHVAGPQPFDDVPWWMAAADIVALASWNEGTPNVLLEALSCGRRVIGTDVGGIPDLVENATRGRVVPVRDAASLADALVEELPTDYDPAGVADDIGARTWADCAGDLLAIIEEAVEARS